MRVVIPTFRHRILRTTTIAGIAACVAMEIAGCCASCAPSQKRKSNPSSSIAKTRSRRLTSEVIAAVMENGEESTTEEATLPSPHQDFPSAVIDDPSAAAVPTMFVPKAKVKHAQLGYGIIGNKPARREDGKILFQWQRNQQFGRKKKAVVFNRWVRPEELTADVHDEPAVLDEEALNLHQNHSTEASGDVPASDDDEAEHITLDGVLPRRAAHHKERKLQQNTEALRKPRLLCGSKKSKPVQHISAEAMIRDGFSNECLVPDAIDKHAVFCRACKKSYPLIKSSLTAHVSSSKHKSAVQAALTKGTDDSKLKLFLEDYCMSHPREKGATVSSDIAVYRYRVVEAMLASGIALNKLNSLRPLLERSGVCLSDRSHLSSFVPRILERERALLEEELKDQLISFIFDGTTRLGEAVNVIYRFCPPDFSQIMMRLVNFTTLESHMNGNALGQHLNDVLTSTMRIPRNNVVGSSRDSCSTNGAGLRVIHPLFPALLDCMCYSHMLQGTGARFQFEHLDEFMTSFLILQSMAVVKSVWKQIVGTSMKGYSKIRWWSRWELMTDLAGAFGPALDRFVQTLVDRDIGDATTSKMQAVLNDAGKREGFQLELALVMDLGIFLRTTYLLEGDGLCILRVHELVEKIRALGRSFDDQSSLPNTAALLRSNAKIEEGVKFRQFWSETDAPGESGWWNGKILHKRPGHGQLCAVRYWNGSEMWIQKAEEQAFRGNILAHELPQWKAAVAKVQPAFDYIDCRLTNACDSSYHMKMQHSQMRLFKVRKYGICSCAFMSSHMDVLYPFQVFDPSKLLLEEDMNESYIDAFQDVPPFVVHDLLPGMKQELPKYIIAAQEFNSDANLNDMQQYTQGILRFWSKHRANLPTWAKAAQIVFSLSPSSAGCERVFSLLKHMFGEQRDSSFADQIEVALMLAYNKRSYG